MVAQVLQRCRAVSANLFGKTANGESLGGSNAKQDHTLLSKKPLARTELHPKVLKADGYGTAFGKTA